jgi:translation initiation factor 2A
VAAFNPEAGGKPARVTLYRFTPKAAPAVDDAEKEKSTNVQGPVSSRTIFAASEAKLMWNAPGSALLVYAQADTDATSYYGATGLFLLQAHSDAAIKVTHAHYL